MNRDAYETALHLAANVLAMVDMVPVPGMLNAIEHAESAGPILDPTLYRAKAKAMGQDREMLEALLPAWRMAQKIKLRAERAACEACEFAACGGDHRGCAAHGGG